MAHVRLHAVGSCADRLEVGDSLSTCIPGVGEWLPNHDRGKVSAQTALLLADGGESRADIGLLRNDDETRDRNVTRCSRGFHGMARGCAWPMTVG